MLFVNLSTFTYAELHGMEQQLNLHTEEEKQIMLYAGRQEILSFTKEKLASRLEMLYLSVMKQQEIIQKDTSK